MVGGLEKVGLYSFIAESFFSTSFPRHGWEKAMDLAVQHLPRSFYRHFSLIEAIMIVIMPSAE